MLKTFRSLLRHSRLLRRDQRGNFTIIFGLSAVVLVVFIGMGVDYLTGLSFKSRWDTAADAAALAAIQASEAYLAANASSQSGSTLTQGTISAGQAQGYKSFNANAAASEATESVTPTVTVTLQGFSYTATVTYTGTVTTHFGGLVGIPTLAVSGTASASAGLSTPNVDFYVLLDNSPSMALAASSSGISTLSALTTNSCAFACHEINPNSADIVNNPVVNGRHIDNYAVAKANGITLRIDELNSATTALMSAASNLSTSQPGKPAYRFAVDSMTSTYAPVFTTQMSLTSDYINAWQSASSNFQLMEMYDNNYGCASTTTNGVTDPCGSGVRLPNGTSDADTSYDDSLSKIYAQMPNPGLGTNAAGDTPQEVMFFVTDGVEDQASGRTRLIQQINANGAHDYCADIKARGIKIAILYTTYLPLPQNSEYVQHVEPFESEIAPALQACASTGLFYQASVDDNLSSDLVTLFNLALGQTAPRLTQ